MPDSCYRNIDYGPLMRLTRNGIHAPLTPILQPIRELVEDILELEHRVWISRIAVSVQALHVAALLLLTACSWGTSPTTITYDLAFTQDSIYGPGPTGCRTCVAHASPATFSGTLALSAETTAVISVPQLGLSGTGQQSFTLVHIGGAFDLSECGYETAACPELSLSLPPGGFTFRDGSRSVCGGRRRTAVKRERDIRGNATVASAVVPGRAAVGTHTPRR